MRTQRSAPRSGFTLVELLVVIGLILLLLGISVSISYSGLIDNYKTVGAGDRASGWLLIAKSKAQREGAPRGVRFFVGNGNMIKEAQYIEVPDPFVTKFIDPSAKILILDDKSPSPAADIKRIFITGNAALLNAMDPTAGNVIAGDTLSLPEFGTIHQITSVGPQTTINMTINGVVTAVPVREIFVVVPGLLPDLAAAAATATSNPGQPTAITTAFGFLRQARPMLGEPILQLTGDTAIDGNLSSPVVAGAFVDVLFAPNGEVLNTTNGKTIFWIRNPALNPTLAWASTRAQYEQAGTMNLVTIYTKTGQIATQPVTLPPNADPFAATKDGFNTGL